MKIDIKVIPGAKRDFISHEGGIWKAHLRASAVEGKANKALIALIAKHFAVRKRQIEITKGLKSRHKTISIERI